jgi:hypothetical protein
MPAPACKRPAIPGRPSTGRSKDAKKAAKALIRPFVNQYLRYPPVTNAESGCAVNSEGEGREEWRVILFV